MSKPPAAAANPTTYPPGPARTRGGYDKGSATREQLITVATRIFAAKGFAGATTREICQTAGVNLAAIHYYFGDKDGPVSYTHLRAHETVLDLVCRLLLEKKKNL